MKIFNKTHPTLIKVDFTQQGSEKRSMTLCETTFEDVLHFVSTQVSKLGSVVKKGRSTSARIREYEGGKITKGKDKLITFYGLTPEEIHQIITEKIEDNE